LNNVKSNLHSSLAEKDSFNLIFSQLNIFRASEFWLSADSATIEETFTNLGENPVSSYSNLPSLLANGIEFVKENGNNASIVLISSSDQLGDYQVANQLIDDLLALMNPEIPIHVADFQDRNFTSNYIGGRYYYGNQYFYTNISRLTSANYYSIHSGYSLPELITTTMSSISGFISSFDLHTRLENGYCHSRYNLNSQEHSVYLDRPIVQIGKFQGSFPFIIEVSGKYKSEIFSQQFVVNTQNINPADSISEEAWTGNYIQSLELQPQSNDIIDEIIDYSLAERVLSIYTAFICLEPQRGGQVCYDCMDESELVGIEEMLNSTKNDTIFKAYPNPFNNQVKIEFSLPASLISEDISFKIYNILGQSVRAFQANGKTEGNSYQIIWDGKSDTGSEVSSGTYFFIANTAQKRYSLKLLYMK
jgi:Ca-activated chloride channel family protein